MVFLCSNPFYMRDARLRHPWLAHLLVPGWRIGAFLFGASVHPCLAQTCRPDCGIAALCRPGLLLPTGCASAVGAGGRKTLGKRLEFESRQEPRWQPRDDPLPDQSQRTQVRSRVLLLPATQAKDLLALEDRAMEPCAIRLRLLQCQALPEQCT